MQNLLVVGDVHFTVRQPRARRAAYGSQVLEKLRWVMDLARRMKAVVVCTGDFFHRHAVTFEEVAALAVVLQSAPRRLYGIMGNHDARRMTDLPYTALGLLAQTGVVTMLGNEPVWLEGDVALTGAPYQETEHRRQYRRVLNGCREIKITHGMLVPTKTSLFPSTAITRVRRAPTLLVNGHNHAQFEHEKIVNLGSLTRTSRAEKHEPRVLMVQIEAKTLTHYYHAVPHVKYDRAFDAREDPRVELSEARIDEYVEALREEPALDGLDYEGMLKSLKQKRRIKRLVKQYICAARDQLEQ